MSQIGKDRRNFIKSRMATMAAGGTVESDAEQMQAKAAQSEALGAGAAAQQQVLNQAAAANAAGAPVMAGALQKSAANVTGATQDAAIKMSGQAAQHRAALRAQREGETLAGAERLVAQNRADAKAALDTGLAAVDILSGIGGSASSVI